MLRKAGIIQDTHKSSIGQLFILTYSRVTVSRCLYDGTTHQFWHAWCLGCAGMWIWGIVARTVWMTRRRFGCITQAGIICSSSFITDLQTKLQLWLTCHNLDMLSHTLQTVPFTPNRAVKTQQTASSCELVTVHVAHQNSCYTSRLCVTQNNHYTLLLFLFPSTNLLWTEILKQCHKM